MKEIPGYKCLNYQKFQIEMEDRRRGAQIADIELAMKLGLKTTATIRNAFRKDTQVVSDEVMSGLMDLIDLTGFILWINGKRYYYLKI